MKYLELTRDLLAVVDDDIYDTVSRWHWYAQATGSRNFYAARRFNYSRRVSKIILLHHYVLDVEGLQLKNKGLCVDHINRDSLDNRLCNLRIVTQQENMLNTRRSLFRTGIGIDRTHNTFKAYIDMPGEKRINLGTRKTREEAELLVAEYKAKYEKV